MPGPVVTEHHIERKSTDPLKSELLCFESRASLQCLAEDRTGAVAIVAELQAFVALSYVLAKRIVDLEETIEFYELNWLVPPEGREAVGSRVFGDPD